MTAYHLLPIVQTVFAVVLAVIVIRGNITSRLHVLFSLFLSGIALWGFIIFRMRSASGLDEAFLWERWTVPLAAILAALLVDFAFTAADSVRPKTSLVLYVCSAIFIPLAWTRAFISGMYRESYGYAPVVGPFYVVWSIYCIILVATAIGTLFFILFRSTSPVERNRAAYFVTGIGVAFLSGFLDILPLFGIRSYPGLIIGILFFCGLTAYAIIRHSLLDIRVVFRKALAFIITSSVAALPLLIIAIVLLNRHERGQSNTLYFALFILWGIVSPRLWIVMDRFLERWLNRGRSRTYRMLHDEIQDTSIFESDTRIGERLLALVVGLVDAVGGFLLEPMSGGYRLSASHGATVDAEVPSFRDDDIFIRYLARNGRILSLTELEEIPQIQATIGSFFGRMEALGVSLIIPVLSAGGKGGHRLNAIILLAGRRSEARYRVEDIQELQQVCSQLAIKLDNMHLYLDVKRGRANLEHWFDSMSDCVVITGIDGTVRYANRKARNELGVRVDSRFFSPARDSSAVRRRSNASGYKTYQVELRGRRVDVAEVRINDPDDLENTLYVMRDVTSLLQREEEMARSQRIESLGVMAGGIAHDFNNLLTGLLGNISIAEDWHNIPGHAAEALQSATGAIERARSLTDQLMTFSRGGDPVFEPVDLVTLISDTARFALAGTQSYPSVICAMDLWPALVDRGQFVQVISNLVINASQAMPEGGTVEVECKNVEVGDDWDIELQPGKYVQITVRDEGEGIEEDVIGRIFDPYYTTKEHGTGLGLAVVFSIVKKHRGHILVRSIPADGTTFEVLFPAAAMPEIEHIAPGRTKATAGYALVMDDDEVVRKVLILMLRHLGWVVVGVQDGFQAIDEYRKALGSDQEYGVVILDLSAGRGMGGGEAGRNILELDPEAKIIVTSGFAADQMMSEYASHGFCCALRKPYTLPSLESALRVARPGMKRHIDS